MNYNRIAEQLDKAAFGARPMVQISLKDSINVEEAYVIQSISVARRYARGEKFMGIKMGFTNLARMHQMGVPDLIWGKLTDKMAYINGAILKKANYIHPRAEPEIAFKVGKEIKNILTLKNVKEYVSHVAIAIEIIDSRYEDFKFSLPDIIADNCSSAAYVLGRWHSKDINVIDIPINFYVDNELIHSGTSNAILKNPWNSMIAATRMSIENGEILKKGSVVLAGAATPSSYIKSGQTISAQAEGLGRVFLKVA